MRRYRPLISRAPLTGGALLLGLCGGCGSGDGGSSSSVPDERPNVLLFTLDTTRADYLSCYGERTGTTPRIDEVAADGVLYSRALSTAGITPMSHASILTGLNNYRHGMRVFYSEDCSHTMKDEVDSIPEILAAEGYRTSASISAYVVSEIFNLDQGIQDFLTGNDYKSMDVSGQQKHPTFFDPKRTSGTQRRADWTVEDAVSWLEDVKAEGAPWFMWIHLFDVHDFSLVPSHEYLAEQGITELPPIGTRPSPQDQFAWRNRLYVPEMRWMDQRVGEVLDWLRDNGEYDQTVVVITADHGQGMEDGQRLHGWSKHRLLYDWCVHVPLIVKLPESELSGTTVDTQVRTIDIAPTILDALGISGPDMDGRSALGLARGEDDGLARIAYAEALNLYDTHSPGRRALPKGHYDNLYSVSDGDWKLVLREEDQSAHELYNVSLDPDEQANLYRADHPEVTRLRAFLDEHEPWNVELPFGDEAASSDALNALGYTGGDEDEEDE